MTTAELHQLADELLATVDVAAGRLRQFSEAELNRSPAPGKWSPKQVVGHLVDSAHNNIRRFVCGQYQEAPHIVYHQDEWVAAQAYEACAIDDLLTLWVALNRHLAHIWRHLPAGCLENVCDTGKESPQLRTLAWLAADYGPHLRHHLKQAGVE